MQATCIELLIGSLCLTMLLGLKRQTEESGQRY
jgi:hypothetical protein